MSSGGKKASRGETRSPTRIWRSLGGRLAIWYVAVTLLSYLALAAILPLTVHAWVDGEGQRSTESALERYRQALEAGGTDALRSLFACDAAPSESFALRLSDRQDIELYRASSDDAADHLARDLSAEGTRQLSSTRAPEGWHVAAISISQNRQLEMLRHDDSALRSWSRAREVSLIILACGLISAIAGALVITRRSLRPVSDLAKASQQIVDSGDLSLRVPTRGSSDRLDQLAALFNRMLARNETLMTAMKESLDNVAHDLRTPLTRLRAGAELALARCDDPAAMKDALGGTLEESDRVLSMLTTLMDITGAETGVMQLHKQREDLGAIARESVDLYDVVASERGSRIVTRISANVFVAVDRARIRQVCANLLDNAVKYTPPGGQIEIAVLQDGAWGLLTVADNGVGIAPEDQPRVWDRLYRGDRSRAESGLGLGLSLVKAVVDAHGGEVRLTSTVGVGSEFHVRLPLDRSPAVSTSDHHAA